MNKLIKSLPSDIPLTLGWARRQLDEVYADGGADERLAELRDFERHDFTLEEAQACAIAEFHRQHGTRPGHWHLGPPPLAGWYTVSTDLGGHEDNQFLGYFDGSRWTDVRGLICRYYVAPRDLLKERGHLVHWLNPATRDQIGDFEPGRAP